jgi:hypothetical protein
MNIYILTCLLYLMCMQYAYMSHLDKNILGKKVIMNLTPHPSLKNRSQLNVKWNFETVEPSTSLVL